jgi:hypothetical protein
MVEYRHDSAQVLTDAGAIRDVGIADPALELVPGCG